MLFSSLTFLFVFFPLVLFLYFIVKDKYKNIVLLIFSLVFYAWGEPIYIVLMLISIIVNYLSALLIDRYRSKDKLILILNIIFNIGLLGFYKYGDFLVNNLNSVFKLNISPLNLALPIGISFYTFQIMSYVIDVYRKDVKVQKNILTVGTYLTLFPQLIAGPIVRYVTVEDELSNRKESLPLAAEGLRRFIVGLGKKVIIANQMGLLADTILDSNVQTLNTPIIWLGMLAYTMQIYFDFSGYSDMAIGMGKIFGFKFLENFNYPYISTSITEFWRRWHISLSTWFRDYVYIPLGGNRVSKIRWYINIFIVWSLTGLWHGASWNFILWGMYFGTILILEKLFIGRLLEKIPKIFRWLYSIILIVIGWVIFRIESVSNVLIILKKMFIYNSGEGTRTFLINNSSILYCLPFILLAIFTAFPIAKKLGEKISNSNIGKYSLDIGLMFVFTISIIMLISSTYNPFIYFRF